MIRNFSAVPIPLPQRWSTPSTPLLEGARQFLASLDLGAASRSETRCGITGQPAAATRLTPRLRALEVWQATPDTVRVVPRSYQLGDAPRIDVNPDFGAPPKDLQSRTVDSSPSLGRKETQTTTAALRAGSCGFLQNAGVPRPQALQLESSYDCSGPDCALDANGNLVRSFCQLDLPWFAIELGVTVLQSP